MNFGPEIIVKVSDDSKCVPGSFRQKSLKPGLRMILARKRKGESMKPVGYAFQKNMFTAQEVAEWCADHEVKKFVKQTGDLEPVVPAVQETPRPQPPKPNPPVPSPDEEEEEQVGWIAILRGLEDFKEDTIAGRDVADGIKAIVGDLLDDSGKAVVWAITFSSGFTEKEANDWLTSSHIHSVVVPLDDEMEEVINPGPKDGSDLPWNKPISKQVNIFKVENEEMRLVTGVVLMPDIEDSQGDVVSEDEIVSAAHAFMSDYRKQMADVGIMHKSTNQKIEIVESSIAPQDLTINNAMVKKGSWLISVKVRDDAVWKKVKDGTFSGFSIGGKGQREPI